MKTALKDIRVLILCGGLGKRLRAVTGEEMPKPMVSVDGKPFLEIVFDYLVKVGFSKFIFCVGHQGHLIESYFKDKAADIRFSYEKELLGTAGGLKLAESLIDTDSFVALNGDSFCSVAYDRLFEAHQAKGGLATLVLVSSNDRCDVGHVQVNDQGCILGFSEKSSDRSPWINAGVYVMQKDFLKHIPIGEVSSLEKDIFPSLAGEQGKLIAYTSETEIYDIGTPDRLEHFKQYFLSQPKR